MKNTITRNAIFGAGTLVLAFVAFMGAFPAQASAQAYYPGSQYYYDRYCPSPQIATVSSNGFYTCSYPSGPSYQPPVYQPPVYQPPTYPSLSASCYANNGGSVQAGTSVTWQAVANGGAGNYSYTWSGTDGLSGSGPTISMNYYNPGAKTASVVVYSGGQSQSVSCSNSVTVYNNNYNYNQGAVYNAYQYYYSPLSVACTSNVTSAPVGATVTYSAQASGGNGYYQYTWSGTDAIYGQGQSVSYTYNQPGTKYTSVTIYSNGQTITQPCSNVVTIGAYQGGIIGGGQNTGALDIACYADPTTASVNQPVTWSAEVTGGAGRYTYTWSGTEGLSGTGASVSKYYSYGGIKTAVVNVTSADGRTGTRSCAGGVTVRSAASAAPVQPVVQPQQPQNNLGAAAFFSLGNIPWGWVAVIIILVLFAMVMYLLFNKPKM